MAEAQEIALIKQQFEELQKKLQLIIEEYSSATTGSTHHTSVRLNPRPIRTTTKHLIIGTSRTKCFHARRLAKGTMVHSYRGATLKEISLVDGYAEHLLETLVIIGGFNDHSKCAEETEAVCDNIIQKSETKFPPFYNI